MLIIVLNNEFSKSCFRHCLTDILWKLTIYLYYRYQFGMIRIGGNIARLLFYCYYWNAGIKQSQLTYLTYRTHNFLFVTIFHRLSIGVFFVYIFLTDIGWVLFIYLTYIIYIFFGHRCQHIQFFDSWIVLMNGLSLKAVQLLNSKLDSADRPIKVEQRSLPCVKLQCWLCCTYRPIHCSNFALVVPKCWSPYYLHRKPSTLWISLWRILALNWS